VSNAYPELFRRHDGNPILTAAGWPYPAHSVFNPGATLLSDGTTLLLCRVEDRRGHCVNIPIYSPVKAAQRAMAKSLSREWGPLGITVNCIAPVAASPALVGAFEQNPVLEERVTARTSLRRIGDLEHDIGPVAVFLASDDGGYVTGQTIVCDGGSFMGL
jgi:NAD(P)-dependent dehydrogenase (short-subunit alcohol dehydrogenase family)